MRPTYVLVACAGMLVFLLALSVHTGYLSMSKATTLPFFNGLSPPATGAGDSPQEAGSLTLDTMEAKPDLSSPKSNPPPSSKFGLPFSSKSGPPPSSKFGLPFSSKSGLPSSSKSGHPSRSTQSKTGSSSSQLKTGLLSPPSQPSSAPVSSAKRPDLSLLSKLTPPPSSPSSSASMVHKPDQPPSEGLKVKKLPSGWQRWHKPKQLSSDGQTPETASSERRQTKPDSQTVHTSKLVSSEGHKPERASSKGPNSKPVSLEGHTSEPVSSEGLNLKAVPTGLQKSEQISAERQNPKPVSSEGNKPETVKSQGDNRKHAPQEERKPESSSPFVHNSVPEPPGGLQKLLEPQQTRLPEQNYSPGVQQEEPLPEKPAADSPRRVDTGEYPYWWRVAWPRSAVADRHDEYVGDAPLYPSCSTNANPWEAYSFVEPFSYVNTSKNPCWFEEPKIQWKLHCIPYFYLAGVAKCGTSDISRRLRMHPDIYLGTRKEYHWWERTRYGLADDDDPETPVDFKDGTPFDDYTDQISGREIKDQEDDIVEKGFANSIFGDFSPSYLWDPRNWNVLDGNQNCLEPRVIVGQHIHHVFPQAKILLTFRHPTPRLYSRFLSRIRRTPALRGATPEDFHFYVLDAIQKYKDCFKLWSIRHCAYNVSVYKETNVRLVEGMYPVFMGDWLRVWPRDQMFFLRYEDYPGREVEHVNQMVAFLGLAPYSSEDAEEVAEREVVNSGANEYDRIGQMLNATRALLDDFYQPFVTKLAHILRDRRFLWLDVPH